MASNDDGNLVLFENIKRKSSAINDEKGDTKSSNVMQFLLPCETLRVMVGCQLVNMIVTSQFETTINPKGVRPA